MRFLARAGWKNRGQEHQYCKKGNKNVSLLINITASGKQKYLALLVALPLSLVFGFNNLTASEGSFHVTTTLVFKEVICRICCNILVRGSCPRESFPRFSSLEFFPSVPLTPYFINKTTSFYILFQF
jgi:hypothetical protein